MKAIVLDGNWSLDNLSVVDKPKPKPKPHEVVIEIQAISINPRDAIMCQGGYGRKGGSLPIIPLCDGAGQIHELGSEVEDFAVGDIVFPHFSQNWAHGTATEEIYKGAHGGPLDGTAREFMAIPAHSVVSAPSHMKVEEAATLPCAAVTAWNAVVEQGKVTAGDSILIMGTGGVSLFAHQFAKMHGAETIVISSNDHKLDKIKHLGADHLINYKTNPDWHKEVKRLTNGRGVDHVVEIGGTGTLERSIGSVRASGRISLIGVLDGISGNINLGRVVTQNIRLQGVTVGSIEMAKNMVRAMELHQIHPNIDDQRFEFDELASALADLSKGQHFGKKVCNV